MKWLILLNFCLICASLDQHSFIDVLMKAIPSADQVKNIPITPIRVTQTLYNSVLNCTSDSVISIVMEKVETIGNKTCNGFVFSNEKYLYYAVLSAKTVELPIDEMTIVSAAMNGNIIFITCGYISVGECEGDFLFSVQIYKADDQSACAGNGLVSQKAVYYPMEIYGKCQSTCTLGYSNTRLTPALFI